MKKIIAICMFAGLLVSLLGLASSSNDCETHYVLGSKANKKPMGFHPTKLQTNLQYYDSNSCRRYSWGSTWGESY